MAEPPDESPPRSDAGLGWQSEEEAARLQERLEEARHRRTIQKWIVLLAVFTVLVIYVFCMYEILFGTPADKVWAWPITTIIVFSLCSALVGYAIGRNRRQSGN